MRMLGNQLDQLLTITHSYKYLFVLLLYFAAFFNPLTQLKHALIKEDMSHTTPPIFLKQKFNIASARLKSILIL